MPGPMDTSFESGFNPTGESMADLASPAAYPMGVALPGDAQGYNPGTNMTGMASPDAIPQGNAMGAAGNDGIPDHDGDLSSSAGYHLVTSFSEMFPGYSGTTPAPTGEQNTYNSGPGVMGNGQAPARES